MQGWKTRKVHFVDKQLKGLFDKLAFGTADEKELCAAINHALDALLSFHECGIKIQRDRWPKEYIQRFSITNLWKYDLPKGWRLIYTVKNEEVEIITIVLEWFSHKEYERKFGY